jgi:hypothetical protein
MFTNHEHSPLLVPIYAAILVRGEILRHDAVFLNEQPDNHQSRPANQPNGRQLNFAVADRPMIDG